jgi:hypothetical protein
MVEGITTERTNVPSSARVSIRFNPESDSNEMNERLQQSEKHDEQRYSTLCGITIDRREEKENASTSIISNSESDSNEMDESDSHLEKQDG